MVKDVAQIKASLQAGVLEMQAVQLQMQACKLWQLAIQTQMTLNTVQGEGRNCPDSYRLMQQVTERCKERDFPDSAWQLLVDDLRVSKVVCLRTGGVCNA